MHLHTYNIASGPIADTVRPDQWINGCIELQAESVGVPVFEGGFIEFQCRTSCQSDFVRPGAHM